MCEKVGQFSMDYLREWCVVMFRYLIYQIIHTYNGQLEGPEKMKDWSENDENMIK